MYVRKRFKGDSTKRDVKEIMSYVAGGFNDILENVKELLSSNLSNLFLMCIDEHLPMNIFYKRHFRSPGWMPLQR